VEVSGADYFYGRIWGAPAVLLNFVLVGWFLGQEKNAIVLWISLVGNLSNVFLDYVMIMQWGWASAGAGIATTVSQYLSLLVGLIGVALTINWSYLGEAFSKILHRTSLKETLALNSNILIRFIVLISTFAIFTNISSAFGTTTLAQNGVLLQIALLSQFTVNGVGLTTQTLASNFKSKGTKEQLLPLLMVSILTSLVIASLIVLVCILFPDQVFGLLTNHTEVTEDITKYSFWLLPLLEITAIAFMLDGYFTGLKEGNILRNGVLVAFCLFYLPCLALAWYLHSNNWLWFSLVAYMTSLTFYLGWRVPKTLQSP
jgi:MATE family multidrug resistance protein